MIPLGLYDKSFEDRYWKVVERKIDASTQRDIILSCKKFLPTNFFSSETAPFKQLVLAPFKKIKEAQNHIIKCAEQIMREECFYNDKLEMKKIYKDVHDSYSRIADSTQNGISLRVQLVKETGLTVCPYCNRDYINCRGGKISGAQLDHFYNKSNSPLFSVCLYNLIPTCSNCNRVKGAKSLNFCSPFDHTVLWDNLCFKYMTKEVGDISIEIDYLSEDLKDNITGMGIKEAYEMHSIEVQELIDKNQCYTSSQKEEFKDIFEKSGITITDEDIKKVVFGPQITKQQMKSKPLGKLYYDLHKQLNIYSE